MSAQRQPESAQAARADSHTVDASPPTLRVWLNVARPKTLTAAVAPVLAGTAWAYAEGHRARLWLAGLALVSALLIQIGTNLINDAEDFRRGADDEDRVGPRRATQSGWLTAQQVWLAAIAAFALACIAAVPLVINGGWPIVVVGLVSLVCGWAYTAGPRPLAYHGLGEVFVFAFFGVVAVSGTTWILAGRIAPGSLLAGAQIGALATALISINNLRDHEGDARVAKRTLAVRGGPRLAKALVVACVLTPFAALPVWALLSGPWPAALPLVALPLALGISTTVVATPATTAEGETFNRLLGRAAALHLAFSALLSLGLVIAAR